MSGCTNHSCPSTCSGSCVSLYFLGILAAFALIGLFFIVPLLLPGTILVTILVVLLVVIIVLLALALIVKALACLFSSLTH